MPQSGFKSGVSALLQRKAGSLSFTSVRINQMFNIKFALSQQTEKKKKTAIHVKSWQFLKI